jgi:hypothetical protein
LFADLLSKSPRRAGLPARLVFCFFVVLKWVASSYDFLSNIQINSSNMTRIFTLIATVSLLSLASCASHSHGKKGSCCGADKAKKECCDSKAKEKKDCGSCTSTAKKKA